MAPYSPNLASLARGLSRISPQDNNLSSITDALLATIKSAVPFSFACIATTDPSTGLISAAYKSEPLDIGDDEWAATEYGAADINLFSDLALRESQMGVLSIDTDGELDKCRRFRDYLAPTFGFTDELRVVLSVGGLTWGALALYRGADGPRFTAGEGNALSVERDRIATLLRDTLFATERRSTTEITGPAVIVVDSDDQVSHITAAAHACIDDLGGWDNGSLPSPLVVATAAARTRPELATTRSIGLSGRWIVIRATTFAGGADVVLTIDAAAPTDISGLALSARGLSGREQEVAHLVLQGASTKAIAASLYLSPHTVQDHLKSIFDKLGVSSRREMVQQLALKA